ncbi:MAG: SpoIIIAH-like family protein [Oscillospiraceae bacterium]|nr:SpoIIIAH-like family protein [Oscillospiraceae bacterium]
MKKLLQKRQLVMVTLVLALAAAVFINWYYSDPYRAVNAQPVTTAANTDAESEGSLGDAQFVHGSNIQHPMGASAREYFAGARLNRNAAHDEARAVLSSVIADSQSDPTAVAQASESLQVLSNAIRLQSECEALITAQTGREALVVVGDNSVRAVVGGGELDRQTVTQITEILLQKTGVSADNIQIVELNR